MKSNPTYCWRGGGRVLKNGLNYRMHGNNYLIATVEGVELIPVRIDIVSRAHRR